MEEWQRLLAELRGARTVAQWARDLGLHRQTVHVWFAERPSKPTAANLAAVLRDASCEQRDRLLAALDGNGDREMVR